MPGVFSHVVGAFLLTSSGMVMALWKVWGKGMATWTMLEGLWTARGKSRCTDPGTY